MLRHVGGLAMQHGMMSTQEHERRDTPQTSANSDAIRFAMGKASRSEGESVDI